MRVLLFIGIGCCVRFRGMVFYIGALIMAQNRTIMLSLLAILALFINAPARAAAYIKWDCSKGESSESCAQRGGIKYIYIFDEIDHETAVRMAMVDGLFPLGAKFPVVYLNSPGGTVVYAKIIGRILRRRMASVIGKDVFFPKQAAICSSACVMIAAGAVDRQLNQIGLHRSHLRNRIKGSTYKYEPGDDATESEITQYYKEMGINPKIMAIREEIPHTEITKFFYDPTKSPEGQTIVELGFRMEFGKGDEVDLSLLPAPSYSGFQSLLAAAEEGDSVAAYILGTRHFFGENGRFKDVKLGLKWLKKSAELGSALAQQNLGVIYTNGLEGVEKNYKIAVQYNRLSAELGNAGAQNNLGWAYYLGRGVHRNYAQAVYWLTRSAAQGEPFAYSSLGEMYYRRVGFPAMSRAVLKFAQQACSVSEPMRPWRAVQGLG